jgi:hypothetical protein
VIATPSDEGLAVIDAMVTKARDVEDIVAAIAVGIDDGVRQNLALQSIQQGL